MANMEATFEDSREEIREQLDKGRVIIGTNKTLTLLRKGAVSKIYVTSNCPKEIEEDINHYSNIAKIKVVKLNFPNEQLGQICKKPFSISVLSIKK